MRKLTITCLIFAVSGALYSIFAATQIAAQSGGFFNVIPFSTNVGRIGFFDQNSGKIFIYDGDGKSCLFSAQIKELGKPLEPISATTPERPARINNKTVINEKGEKTVIVDQP